MQYDVGYRHRYMHTYRFPMTQAQGYRYRHKIIVNCERLPTVYPIKYIIPVPVHQYQQIDSINLIEAYTDS